MKKTVKQLVKQAETCKRHLASERDKLRDILDDLGSICDDTSEGIRELEDTIDILSRLI